MEEGRLEKWLRAYGDAWERKDAEAFTCLFSPNVLYYWTPFEEPKQGRDGLAEAVLAAVSRQRDIHFTSEILATGSEAWGIAHWHCTFDRIGTGVRVSLDGIFLMEFDEGGLCTVFREWWHSDEPQRA
jgi:ketosteroid isomerase-like protein